MKAVDQTRTAAGTHSDSLLALSCAAIGGASLEMGEQSQAKGTRGANVGTLRSSLQRNRERKDVVAPISAIETPGFDNPVAIHRFDSQAGVQQRHGANLVVARSIGINAPRVLKRSPCCHTNAFVQRMAGVGPQASCPTRRLRKTPAG